MIILGKWSLGEQAMEEFLVGIKQKECIFLTMGRNQRTFRNLKRSNPWIIHFDKVLGIYAGEGACER